MVAPPLRFSGTSTSSWCCTQGLFILCLQRGGHLEGQINLFQEESEDTGESVTGKKGRCWGRLLSQGTLRQAHQEWGELSLFPLPPRPSLHPSCLASALPPPQCHHDHYNDNGNKINDHNFKFIITYTAFRGTIEVPATYYTDLGYYQGKKCFVKIGKNDATVFNEFKTMSKLQGNMFAFSPNM